MIEGSFSEEGLSAMSECEDMTTLMARELMMGIKDSVEDLAATFKRMAMLKPQTAAWSIFRRGAENGQRCVGAQFSIHIGVHLWYGGEDGSTGRSSSAGFPRLF